MGHGIADEFEILYQGNAERIGDVQRPGFSEKRDDRGLRLKQCPDIRILLHRVAGFSRRPECHHRRRLQRDGFDHPKELDVFRVRPGPSAFNELHTQPIQLLGDPNLVFSRETDIFGLGSIP